MVHRWADDLTIYQGDVRDTLANVADESVQTCVTSPPYWGLRDYGTADWEGGNPDCDHKVSSGGPSQLEGASQRGRSDVAKGACPRCGARRIDSQLGLEPTIEEYVANMVGVFREVRRVLRKDGSLWLNLGDSYNGSGGAGGDYGPGGLKEGQPKYPGRNVSGLKAKDLCGIPWRVAFALQADGWWLRSDIIWAKPNPMPESVTDRPTKAHEYIFLLTKSPTYYYDADAIRESLATEPHAPGNKTGRDGGHLRNDFGTDAMERVWGNPAGRNKRTVWTVATQPTPEAHFATYPTKLIEPCIIAGTSPQACPKCGAPWERVTEKTGAVHTREPAHQPGNTRTKTDSTGWQPTTRPTETFRPTCPCADNDGSGKCLVLDPFHGSGTTALVALENGRAYVGCELNPAYIEISRRRIQTGQTKLAT